MKKLLVSCLLLASASAAWADRLYVRNRPFEGYVIGTLDNLSALEVDARDFARALGYNLDEVDGNWVLRSPNDKSAPALTAGAHKLYAGGHELAYRADVDRKLVKLADLAQALGGRVVRHSELGTVDFDLINGYKEEIGFDPKQFHLIYYGADWAPAAKLFKPVVVEFDLKKLVPVIYVDCMQPRSPVYKNFIRYFNGDKIPYVVLLGPNGKVAKTWTGYQDIGPWTTEIQKLTGQRF
ncbi:MAG: hypothetical protein J0I12_12405 [Candidatus Eremiobacteraeota bacterium]|nr:hypothetical protein [Candidatus Eremiobacteraeota bacterium]